MTGLKLFVNLISPPSRAVILFVKLNNIPHEIKSVQLKKGDHLKPDYLKNVHRFGKVPAILDHHLNIIESVAILRYLSRQYDVPEHWYPQDLKGQAQVDEFLEWQHLGMRYPLSHYTQIKFFIPILTGEPPSEKDVDFWKEKVDVALNEIEHVWLKSNPYLVGDKISIADLIGICELDQPLIAGYNSAAGRSKIASWQERVRKELQPHYDEVTSFLRKVVNKFKGDPFISRKNW